MSSQGSDYARFQIRTPQPKEYEKSHHQSFQVTSRQVTKGTKKEFLEEVQVVKGSPLSSLSRDPPLRAPPFSVVRSDSELGSR